MFVVLSVLICVKTCSKRNKSLLKINKTIKRHRAGKNRTKKNSIPKEFTNIKAETSSEAFNHNVTNETHLKTTINNAEISQIAEFQIAKQEPINPPPAVENEFQILRKQLLSNIKNNNDNYENIMNNNDFKRNNKFKY
jgi:hypothetical protein